jgi:hypothetical protein
MRTVTVAGWSKRKEKVFPRGTLRAVLANSGVDFAPTLNTEWVCDSPEIVARTAAPGTGAGVGPVPPPPPPPPDAGV